MTLLLVMLPTFLFKSLDAPLSAWLLGIAAALLTVSGALALSKAFAMGKAAIVAPLVTSYGVVTTLLSWASGEHISLIQLGCIALCVIGVILSSIHKDNGVPHNNPRLSIAYAMLAALLYGTSFWLQGRYTLPALGPITMLWLGYLVGVCVLVMMVLKIKDGLKIPPLKNCLTLTGAEPDEPRRVLGVCTGCGGGVGFGGDGDQYLVRWDRGDSGVCVFQGAAQCGAGAGGCIGIGRSSSSAHRRPDLSPHKKTAPKRRFSHCIKPTLTT